jgi:hypothetical protein
MNPYWVIGIVMAAGLQVQAQECGVNVYVIAGVAMPGSMLLDARLRATRMFREIGVNLRVRMSSNRTGMDRSRCAETRMQWCLSRPA